MPVFLACVWNSVQACASVCACVSEYGTDRGMILTVSQAQCSGSVSMALAHIHRHHISSFFLSLTQTLHNTAALLCTQAFHFHSDSKLPTYKVSAQNMPDMHVNTYVHACLCASGWAGLIVLHRKKKCYSIQKIPPAFSQHNVPAAYNSSKLYFVCHILTDSM